MSIDTNGINTIPAIYAQAYQGGNGKRYVVLTNKGSNAVPVNVVQDNVTLTNQFLETFVAGSDPNAVNISPTNSPVFIQSTAITNTVTLPQYSVVRLEWTVSTVPGPALQLAVSNASQYLSWAGSTNVIYDVQSVTNATGVWTTSGRVTNATTNFAFTNWNSGPRQFYRLAVP